MKLSIVFTLFFSSIFLSSCSSSSEPMALEIEDFRLMKDLHRSFPNVPNSDKESTIKVTFENDCVNIVSKKELLNLVIRTSESEESVLGIKKNEGTFCSRGKGKITTIWVSTKDKEVTKHRPKRKKKDPEEED